MMKHRRIDIFGHQTSLALEPEYWGWLKEIMAKTGASLRDIIEAVAATGTTTDRSLRKSAALSTPSFMEIPIRSTAVLVT